MADLAKYVVSLEAETRKYRRELQKANAQLSRFTKQQTKQLDRVRAGFNKLAGAALVLTGAGGALRKLTAEARSFSVLSSSLITATGSAEGATEAFKQLEAFAARTPFALEESVNGFIRLVNLGLTPSIEALESFGNTAAATGKNLNQFVEAVADAVTNEFERLKEFGIKARKEGDLINFTFRGVTTTVKANAREIEEFLTRLGQVEFAGALEDRARSLDGALSNLADSWDGLFRAISGQGIGELIADQVRTATEALDSLSLAIQTGGRTVLQALNERELILQRIESGGGRSRGQAGARRQARLQELNAVLSNASLVRAEIAGLEAQLTRLLEAPTGGRSAAVGRSGQIDQLRTDIERLRLLAVGLDETDLSSFSKSQVAAVERLVINSAQTTTEEAAAFWDDFVFGRVQGLKEIEEAQRELNRSLLASEVMTTPESAASFDEMIFGRFDEMKERAEAFNDLFTDNMVQAAEFGFDSILESWGRTLQQMAARALASQLFRLLGFGEAGGGFLGIGRLFGGTRADGGPVSSGRGYLVGERGPELFIPRMSGQIVPNGGGAVSVGQITINAPFDQRGLIRQSVTEAIALAEANRIDARRRGR